MCRSVSIPVLLFATAVELGVAQPPRRDPVPPPFLLDDARWADSVLQSLTLRQRVAQLMMVAAYSNKDEAHTREIEQLVREEDIGGLIFFQGGPVRQAILTNRYQAEAPTPLLIGMDLEWGLAMRLDSTVRFPKQMTLGAMREDAAIEAMGAEIARQMQRLGVQVSFSPVADVNSDPDNPVINDRSFGEDREAVARKCIAYMKGLQAGGVIATAKHFPGHGDTNVDSHKALPVIAHSRIRLDSLDLYPFEQLMREGLSAIMVAHLEVPALDSTPGLPSTLSRPIVHGLLEDELGFKGLVFTDALNMKGVANADSAGEIELRALLAGNDVLLFPQDPEKAINRIMRAIQQGELSRDVVDNKCLKVLRAKQWARLDHFRPVRLEGLIADLNAPVAHVLRRRLYQGAITVLRDKNELLPLRRTRSMRIASLVIGDTLHNPFQTALEQQGAVDKFACGKDIGGDSLRTLIERLKDYDVVIASVHRTSFRVQKDFGVPDSVFDLVKAIAADHRTVLVLFGNPYRLARTTGMANLDGLVVGYEDDPDMQDLTAQAIYGALGADGRLPVSANKDLRTGQGLTWEASGGVPHGLPEELGVRTIDLAAMDTIVMEGMARKAYPGCRVLVAVDGEAIWDKCYGKPTYDAKEPVRAEDVYDIASITKVAATTLCVMKLVDDGRIDLNRDLGTYLPELQGVHDDYAALHLRDILTHQAGLKDWVPFYKKLVKGGAPIPGVVTDKPDARHGLRVTERVYIDSAFRDSIRTWILNTPIAAKKEYKYSDLGMYLMQWVVERVSGMSLDAYVDATFYAPLGLSHIGYHPRDRFQRSRIVPTEYDAEFRQQQVWGDVHDPGAAMLGGVAGHAGLFSDPGDLAVLMQLLLNKGAYGGRRYLSEAVVNEFTRCQFCAPKAKEDENRRGLGFDKPVREGKGGPTCGCVSLASFGHTGFTGTMVWADPDQNVVYVFLSNRVYPTALNKALIQLDIRTRIQEVVHDAVAAREREGKVKK
ncbi:MAG: serine hydrolase [Flavobacteriales bacterium]|nr:serine hydrolase [Flavobacteriales bacterium]MCB9168663.1 serine hydrolase [Flavobacteriales bacterium]